MFHASLVVRNSQGDRVAHMSLFSANDKTVVEKFVEDADKNPTAQEAFVFMRHFYGPDAIISIQAGPEWLLK